MFTHTISSFENEGNFDNTERLDANYIVYGFKLVELSCSENSSEMFRIHG